MALKWSPSEVNIATSATTGATHAPTGFIFTFPIFLLASQAQYELAPGPDLLVKARPRLAFIGIVASMFAGFLGDVFHHLQAGWLVEIVSLLPGFEAT
ncbi:MAG: hypothetical protein CM15mP18_2910 [Methanobacteriota archaeon]|nr:MAG: hypothetical protein CM15mP18_2910 [Euryarchaeota archaeon]